MKESIYEKERYNMLTSEVQEFYDEIEAEFIDELDRELLDDQGIYTKEAPISLEYVSSILSELQATVETLQEQFENEQERADIAHDEVCELREELEALRGEE